MLYDVVWGCLMLKFRHHRCGLDLHNLSVKFRQCLGPNWRVFWLPYSVDFEANKEVLLVAKKRKQFQRFSGQFGGPFLCKWSLSRFTPRFRSGCWLLTEFCTNDLCHLGHDLLFFILDGQIALFFSQINEVQIVFFLSQPFVLVLLKGFRKDQFSERANISIKMPKVLKRKCISVFKVAKNFWKVLFSKRNWRDGIFLETPSVFPDFKTWNS